MFGSILFRKCVEECEHSGCVGNTCFQPCRIFSGVATDGPWYMQEPLYLQWKQWDCKADCRYHCMLEIENEKQKLGQRPVKYHGQWPFKRVFGSRSVMCQGIYILCLITFGHEKSVSKHLLIDEVRRCSRLFIEADDVHYKL